MEAFQPRAGGQPPSPSTKPFSSLFYSESLSPIDIKKPVVNKGELTVFFIRDDIDKLATPYKFFVLGKFSHGRPKLKEI